MENGPCVIPQLINSIHGATKRARRELSISLLVRIKSPAESCVLYSYPALPYDHTVLAQFRLMSKAKIIRLQRKKLPT